MNKLYLTADALLAAAVDLAFRVIDSGYRPDMVVGVWRGGTPVAIALHEVMTFAGILCDHIAIRTTSYSGIAERGSVRVDGLDYVREHLAAGGKLLLVDDVYDTGLSLDTVLTELATLFADGKPDCRIATPWFKPGNNRTTRVPDYFLYETADWLVFPHELAGLDDREIRDEKPLSAAQKTRLLALRDSLA